MSAITITVREPILRALVELHAIEERGEEQRLGKPRPVQQTAAELLEDVVLERFHHVFGVPLAAWLQRRRSCVGGRGPVSVASAGTLPKERKV